MRTPVPGERGGDGRTGGEAGAGAAPTPVSNAAVAGSGLYSSGSHMAVEPPVSILLVDDRPENLLALEAILEPLGQRLVRANSGDEALKRILQEEFAAILLDVQMPGLSGFDTARIIKSRERSRAIPIIFLTAISKDEEYVFRGYEVGAVDYMFKPFNPDVLRSKVSVFVDLYRKQEQLRRQEQRLRDNERREMELRHREELVESQARLAEVVGSAMDAIVTFDAEQRVQLFNAAAERVFGRPSSEIVGRPVGELFPEPFRADYLRTICDIPPSAQQRLDAAAAAAAAAASGTTPPAAAAGAAANAGENARVRSLIGVRAGGERFPIEASVSCLDLGNGVLYTMIARDVSERQRAEEALRTQAVSLANTTAELRSLNEELHHRQTQLEEAMKARNRFYASMSHELRTPINAVIGYTTLLLDNIYGPLTEKQAQGLQRTHKAAKHLLELVNDVLDLSKIEAGKIELSLQPVSFPAIIEDLFVTVRPMADQHASTLTIEPSTADPVTVVTDPRRVRQILLNLLSNAIKFGRGQPVRVAVTGRDDGGVEVAVIDAGPGISAPDLARIFDEFVQVHQGSESPEHLGGTGLGLPISKRLAALLGGALEAESTPGKGSVFRLILPKSADARLEVVSSTPPSPNESPSGDDRGAPASSSSSSPPAAAAAAASSRPVAAAAELR
ncbi:MAG TPA: ATP-binding protein [Gemmatimonadaceae bacterium]|nr:ATP-binding protein [Gemmatimonadaceae bacterium]